MKKLTSFLYSVLGGMCIGIGGVVFLSCENKVCVSASEAWRFSPVRTR